MHCNRPCSGHKGPTGSSCKKEPLKEEQLREHHKELKRELKGKKMRSRMPKRNQRSTSTSTAPDVTGNALGSNSVPTKASPGTRGQASGDSDLIRHLVNALRDIRTITPNTSHSQGLGSGRRGLTPQRERERRNSISSMNSQQQQWTDGQLDPNATQQVGQLDPNATLSIGTPYYYPPHHFMQPTPLPRFHETMSVDGWMKASQKQ